MADEVIKYQFETNANEVAQEVNSLEQEFKGLDATFEDVYGDIKPLTGRLGELEDRMYELAQAGDTTSKEFKELTKEAGRLKNVQKEVDLQLDRTSRTLDQKFSSAVSLATGTMVVAQGAMNSLGVSSQESEELMADMFATMAVGEGLKQINEATGIFTKMGSAIAKTTVYQKIATAAQWMWNKAMTANPIGLLVVAIAAVVAGITLLVRWFDRSAAKAELSAIRQKKSIEKIESAVTNLTKAQKKNTDEQKTAGDQELALMKAQGKSTAAIRKRTKELMFQAEMQALLNTKMAEARLEQSKDAEKNFKGDREGDEFKAMQKRTKDLEAFVEKTKEIEKKAIEDTAAMNHRFRVEDAQANTDARNRESDAKNTKQENDKIERESDEAEEKQKKEDAAAEELARLQQFLSDEAEVIEDSRQRRMEGDRYAYFEAKRTENTRYEQSLTDLKKSLDLGIITQAEYDAKVKAAKVLHTANLKQIETTETTRKESAKMDELSKELNDMNTSFERKKEILLEQREWILNNTKEGSAERFELLNANAQNEAALDQEAYQRKVDNAAKIAQMTGQLLGVIQTMQQAQFDEDNKNGKQDEKSKEERAKKQFKAQKKMNIAMAVVNASQAIISSLAQSPVAIGAVPSPIGIASLALASASGLASIAAISKTTFQGGGGSVPQAPSFNPQSPTFNTVGQSAATTDDVANGAQAQIDGASDRPTRAYVVSTDITSQQALDRATESQGELG